MTTRKKNYCQPDLEALVLPPWPPRPRFLPFDHGNLRSYESASWAARRYLIWRCSEMPVRSSQKLCHSVCDYPKTTMMQNRHDVEKMFAVTSNLQWRTKPTGIHGISAPTPFWITSGTAPPSAKLTKPPPSWAMFVANSTIAMTARTPFHVTDIHQTIIVYTFFSE